MATQNPPARYGFVAMILHWAIAALILIDFGCAVSFSQFDPGDTLYFASAYRMHMSIGMYAFALSVLCVLWRLMHKYPPLPPDMNTASRVLANAAHVLLYAFIIVVPFTGWAVLSVRGKPAAMIGAVNWPNLAYLADMTREQRLFYHKAFLPAHLALSYIAISLVGLHVLAALYHHFYRRDDVLMRMLPGSRTR